MSFSLHFHPFCLNLRATPGTPSPCLDWTHIHWHGVRGCYLHGLMKFSQPAHNIGSFSQFQRWVTWVFRQLGCLSQVTRQQTVPQVLAICWHIWCKPIRGQMLSKPHSKHQLSCLCFSYNHCTASTIPFKFTQLFIRLGLPVRVSFLRADLPQCPSWTSGTRSFIADSKDPGRLCKQESIPSASNIPPFIPAIPTLVDRSSHTLCLLNTFSHPQLSGSSVLSLLSLFGELLLP